MPSSLFADGTSATARRPVDPGTDRTSPPRPCESSERRLSAGSIVDALIPMSCPARPEAATHSTSSRILTPWLGCSPLETGSSRAPEPHRLDSVSSLRTSNPAFVSTQRAIPSISTGTPVGSSRLYRNNSMSLSNSALRLLSYELDWNPLAVDDGNRDPLARD